MTISNNWVVKWAYLTNGFQMDARYNYATNKYERKVSLCQLFWRFVGSTVLALGCLGLAGAILFFAGRAIIHNWKDILLATAATAVCMAVIIGIGVWIEGPGGKFLRGAAESVGSAVEKGAQKSGLPTLWAMIKSVKAQFCPIIEVTTEDD